MFDDSTYMITVHTTLCSKPLHLHANAVKKRKKTTIVSKKKKKNKKNKKKNIKKKKNKKKKRTGDFLSCSLFFSFILFSIKTL